MGLNEIFKSFIMDRPFFYSPVCKFLRYSRYFKCELEYTASRVIYNAPIHPFYIIEVNPNDIERRLKNRYCESNFIRTAPVVSGDWDQNTRPISSYDLFKSINNRIKNGVDWEETELWKRVEREINNDSEWEKWGCTTISEFKDRCEKIDQISREIEQNGYQTQRQLEGEKEQYKTYSYYPPEWHEISIHIGRDGELIHHEGRHRLAIAQALEIESVPCRVIMRHTKWQKKREQVLKQNSLDDLPRNIQKHIDHPDIEYIV